MVQNSLDPLRASFMRLFSSIVCALALAASALAGQASEPAGPVYQRQSMGGWYGGWYGQGGNYRSSRGSNGRYYQQSSGNWFVRPYPYHFDYYKWRYNVPPISPATADCPCMVEPAPEQLRLPTTD